MSSQPSREELLAAWKAKKAALGTANSQRQPAAAAPSKPPTGLPPRLVARAAPDKENAGAHAAGGGARGGGAPTPAGAAPDSIRKAFASEQQRGEMLQEFDALQGRLAALKRESVRPSISGAPRAVPVQHSTASTTARPGAPLEAAAARATQPAPLARPQLFLVPQELRAARPCIGGWAAVGGRRQPCQLQRLHGVFLVR